jgi:diadenosine tetraphosphatase ApaH/serine/threonine PP2A family protein phosphatase
MRYALVSDLHSNLEALKAVLAHIGDLPILCLGDIVGYGPNPNEVVNLIRSRANAVVLGNHDIACADGTGVEEFNPDAAASAAWTNRHLSEENIAWLLSLPYTISRGSFGLVHGSPHSPERFWYVMDTYDATLAFAAAKERVTFIGHSHFPHVFRLLPNETRATGWAIVGDHTVSLKESLEHGGRFIINVGSTGQPRDEDPRASYVVYDDDLETVTWHRVAYDLRTTQKKIRATTLPARGAARLALGR